VRGGDHEDLGTVYPTGQVVIAVHDERHPASWSGVSSNQVPTDRRAPHSSEHDLGYPFPAGERELLPESPGELELLGETVDVGEHIRPVDLLESLGIVEVDHRCRSLIRL
jgi:hypothetical protein